MKPLINRLQLCCVLLFCLVPRWGRTQVSESFTDADYTQNPAWTGDVGDFEINAALQLHLVAAGSDTSILSTLNTFVDDAEWSAWFRLSFAPSDNNYLRYYLLSDQADLRQPLNGYFLRYGENGSADGLDLWRQDGTVLTKIIDGAPNAGAASTNQLVRFKVIRSATGQWQLWADYAGGYAYQLVGNATDITYTATAYIGVWCKYTAGNASGFYVDDVYVGPIQIDTVAPAVTAVSAPAADTLWVQFSEPVTQASATVLASYAVDNGIGMPVAVSYQADQPQRVKLALAVPLASGQTYTLTVQSVQDMAGNVLTPFSGTVLFYQPQPYDVVITEIMADPSPAVGLPEVEYVEIHNRKNIPIDVTGWKLKVGNTVRVLSAATVPPDSFLLLTGSPLPVEFSTLNAVALPSFPALTNTGATVSVWSAADSLIHTVTYSSSWYADPQKDDGGWALEAVNPSAVCTGTGNWAASTDTSGGTPGRQNSVHDTTSTPFEMVSVTASDSTQLDVVFSQFPDASTISVTAFSVDGSIGTPDSVTLMDGVTCRLYFADPFAQQTMYTLTVSNTLKNCVQNTLTGNLNNSFTYYVPTPYDVVISEIMADPTPVVGCPDAEYVELYNRTAFPISIHQWKIQAGSSVRTLPPGVIPAGGFLLLTIDPLPVEFSALNAVAVPSFPSLANTGGTLLLLSPSGEEISRVTYAVSWYNDGAKDEGGWSLELVNPNDVCNGSANWRACQSVFGGTPGAVNSVNDPQPMVFSAVSATAVSDTSVEVRFNQILDTAALDTGFFSVDQGVGSPDSVAVTGSASCRLYFSAPFSQHSTYTLTVADALMNCAQQPLTDHVALPFTFYTPRPYDLLITEIMPDESPSQGLPLFEYVELHNRAPVPLLLADWRLSVGNTEVLLPPYLLPSGGYVTLTQPGAETFFPGAVAPVPSFPTLSNLGTVLVLRSPSGELIHTLAYSDGWHTESAKAGGGWSLEMKDVNNPCAGKENWASSKHEAGGTPGTLNSVAQAWADAQRPFPIRVGIPSADSLLIYFSEPLRSLGIYAQQFTIPGGIGIPSIVVLEEPMQNTVALKLANFLQPGTPYELLFSDSLRDCVGNRIEIKFPLRFQLPELPAVADVVLNEVLFDPKGDGKDYVELYNRSSKAIDLRRLSLGNYDSATHVLTDVVPLAARSAILMPGQYLLLSVDKTDIYHRYFTKDPTAFWDISSLPDLSNTGGSLALADDNLVPVDAFTFTDAFHFSLLSNKDGVSLERIHPEAPTQSRYNWTSAAASVGYGTPGYQNSQLGIAAEQEEAITLSPEIFSPDQDGFDDVLFIGYEFPTPGNVISITIYDEVGRLVKKLIRNEYTGAQGQYTWDGGTDNNVRPKVGIYVVMAEWFNANGEKGKAKKTVVLGTKL